MTLTWMIVIAIAALGVLLLITRTIRHKASIQKISKQNGWTVEKGLGRSIPQEIYGETLNAFGDPENDYSFKCYQVIRGLHRERSFLIVSKKNRSSRQMSWEDKSHVFTRLSDEPLYPPLMILPASGVLKVFHGIDEGLSELNKATVFEKLALPPEFEQLYFVRGLAGAEEFMTTVLQQKILTKPDMFRRDSEPWYARFTISLNLSERFAHIEVSNLDPNTLMNRLDMLMDWAEIAQSNIESQSNE